MVASRLGGSSVAFTAGFGNKIPHLIVSVS